MLASPPPPSPPQPPRRLVRRRALTGLRRRATHVPPIILHARLNAARLAVRDVVIDVAVAVGRQGGLVRSRHDLLGHRADGKTRHLIVGHGGAARGRHLPLEIVLEVGQHVALLDGGEVTRGDFPHQRGRQTDGAADQHAGALLAERGEDGVGAAEVRVVEPLLRAVGDGGAVAEEAEDGVGAAETVLFRDDVACVVVRAARRGEQAGQVGVGRGVACAVAATATTATQLREGSAARRRGERSGARGARHARRRW